MENKRGITLLALVVTIIILLILAGVTLRLVSGSEGILNKASTATKLTKIGQYEERIELIETEIMMNKASVKFTLEELQTEVNLEKWVTSTEIFEDGGKYLKGTTIEGYVFTVDEDKNIEWDEDTLGGAPTEENITIEATPSEQTASFVERQNVSLKVTSNKKLTQNDGKYAWNQSDTQEPGDWQTLTLNKLNNDAKQRVSQVTKTVSDTGEYYLWVQVRDKTEHFGPYKLQEMPTIANLVCVLDSKSDHDTKGIAKVGSNRAFDGWSCSYSLNGGTKVPVTNGTTTGVNVVKNDLITVYYEKDGFDAISTDLEITELKTAYTLSYDANGGSGAPNDQTQYDITTFTISNDIPTRDLYNFVNWQDASGNTYNSGGNITISSGTSVTLTAQWQAKVLYTLSYDANQGTGAPATQTQYDNATFILSTTEPTRNGYNFINWKDSNSNNTYNPGASITISSGTSVTLTAQWQAKVLYTLSYDANGGTGAPTAQTQYDNATFTLSTTEPTRDGYDFINWKDSNSSTTYNSGASITISSGTTLTLTAQWKPKVTITYNINGGSGKVPNAQKVSVGTTVDIDFSESPKKGSKIFVGYSTNKDATQATYTPAGTATITPNSDITLYAIYIEASDLISIISANNVCVMDTWHTNDVNSIKNVLFNGNINDEGSFVGFMFDNPARDSYIEINVLADVKIYAYGHEYHDSGGRSGKDLVIQKYDGTSYQDYKTVATDATGNRYELVTLEKGKYKMREYGNYVNFDEWEIVLEN